MIDENLVLLFQAKRGRHCENAKGRVDFKDILQNTPVHFNKLASKGAPMKWDDVCFITDKEGEEFPSF
jgi:hypothetical protein